MILFLTILGRSLSFKFIFHGFFSFFFSLLPAAADRSEDRSGLSEEESGAVNVIRLEWNSFVFRLMNSILFTRRVQLILCLN